MIDNDTKAKLDRLEEFGKQDSSLRLMVAAVMTDAGATSLKHLADIDMIAVDELLDDCAMIASQLDDGELITEMLGVAGFHFDPQESPDVGDAPA